MTNVKFMAILKAYRLEQTDLTIIYDSPSICAGPDVARFDYELSDKVFVLKGCVTWQLLSKFYCMVLKRFVNYCFICILLCTDFILAKTDAEISECKIAGGYRPFSVHFTHMAS